MLFDPPATLGVGIGWCDAPGLDVPFEATLSIIVASRVRPGPPSEDECIGYRSLRRLHALQGLALLDVIVVSNDHVRSIAIGCDPDCAWFEPPHEHPSAVTA
jgi:hypothetical protein